MKFTGESKLFLGILVATFALVGFAAWIFTRPTPAVTIPKETLIPADAHQKGNAQATTYLVEFSDFQCPACAAFASTVKTLTDKYQDRLLFVYRHFPLPSHQYALPAAYAAESAALQGKFWETVDYLFANQSKFSDEFFATEFGKDLPSDAVKKKVERDAQAARSLNLPGTPSFFLNGVLLKNLYGPNDLVKAVEGAL